MYLKTFTQSNKKNDPPEVAQVNKKKYYLNTKQQSNSKRENFRLEIRRKAVEQFQRRIRDELNSSFQFHRTMNGHQLMGYQKKQICILRQKDNWISQQSPASGQLSQTLEYLQEMELTHASELCRKSSLCYLRSLAKQDIHSEICEKINRILLKISINELYWDLEFLSSFIELLEEISYWQEGHIDVLQYLANLSQCNILEFKLIIYGHAMTGRLLNPQILPPFIALGKTNTSRSKILQIISNLLLVPPVVSHRNQDLYKFICTPKDYISKLMTILTTLWQTGGNNNDRTSRRESNSQYQLLEVLYGLCVRLEYEDLGYIVSWLHKSNKKWQILQKVMQKYSHLIIYNQIEQNQANKVEQDVSSGAMEIKLKHKLLQISQTIMQFCIYNEEYSHIGLQFIYDLLPQILGLLVNDLASFIGKSRKLQEQSKSQKKKQKYVYSISFEQRYQIMVLKVLYTLLNIRDELGQLPALDYICVRYPSLFQDISEHYCQSSGIDFKKTRIVIWICEIIIGYSPRACQVSWISNFICHVLSSHDETNRNDTLKTILESVLYILQNHENDDHACLLLPRLRESKILKKIEDLAQGKNSPDYYNGEKNTNLLIIEIIDNILRCVNAGQTQI